MPPDTNLRAGKSRKVDHARSVLSLGRDVMSSAEDHRQRAQRYLTMAQTARDPHIANGRGTGLGGLSIVIRDVHAQEVIGERPERLPRIVAK